MVGWGRNLEESYSKITLAHSSKTLRAEDSNGARTCLRGAIERCLGWAAKRRTTGAAIVGAEAAFRMGHATWRELPGALARGSSCLRQTRQASGRNQCLKSSCIGWHVRPGPLRTALEAMTGPVTERQQFVHAKKLASEAAESPSVLLGP